MDLLLLGPLVAEENGVEAALGGPKQRAVLALLAVGEGRFVADDVLLEALWGEQMPPTASTMVQVYISRLRKELAAVAAEPGAWIVREGAGYRLDTRNVSLDHMRFSSLASRGSALLTGGDAVGSRAVFEEALALWRGPALADFQYDEWAQTPARRLDELRLACLEGRIEADLLSGGDSDLVGELEALVAEHPVRERFTAQLMLALYRSGRQAEALETYQRVREKLVEDLGIEPSPDLQALNRQILNQEKSLAGPEREQRPAVKLPAAPTPLVGRRRELSEITELLDDNQVRLVTLVGPGGAGKTRLALAAASELADRRTQGVYWIPLHALRDPSLVMSTIAQALGAEGNVADAIGTSCMLLALDNFEQVVPAASDVARLIAACPSLTVLATSRESLRLAAEHEYAVSGLTESEAVALFNQRARAIRPDLRANGEVTAICHRLDRLPLALELAAARVNVLSPERILEKLDHRFAVLTRGPRDLPDRHQTLRQTIAWSYELLDDVEQNAFARLGVFAGGWALDASEAVCNVDFDVLASLIDKSLVVRRERHVAAEPRYGMLETIREYAVERLTESDHAREVYRSHARWYLELTECVYPELRGAESGKWLEVLECEHDNLRSALTFLLAENELEEAVQLAGALSRFWLTHGHLTEGKRQLEEVLSAGGKQQRRFRAMRGLAIILMERGELDRASVIAEEAFALATETGNDHHAARAAGLLADVAAYRGDLEAARQRYEQAAEASRRAADDRELTVNLYNLGHVARLQGDLTLAERLFEETHSMFCDLDDNVGQAGTLLGLVETAQLRGDREGTQAQLIRALELALDVGYSGAIVDCFNVTAQLAAGTGDCTRAARLWGAAGALDEQIDRAATHPDDAVVHNEAVATARAVCGDEQFDRAWAEGKALSPEDAAAYALEGLRADLSSEAGRLSDANRSPA